MALGFRTATGRTQRRIPGATTHSTGPGGLRALERCLARPAYARALAEIEGLRCSAGLRPATAATGVHTTYLWHMHQPIYWPAESGWTPSN